ncbi:response regulator transcription factor [Anaerosinus gibii]|uniref:Response regulator transcription factor n=1 Tax=Selenobaculum gibii TaxID=3054208 RepID=A0A9Y2AHL0_9FIRM|nr:response regulator transcription factor [Selenobaculum gbiensis]WIW70229.1 response regulator transcription factor [Selenobaculum gbiensis]
MKLLLIEDEVKLSEALTVLLRRAGYTVDTALDGLTGLNMACTNPYDVIILDRMLPHLDGLSVLKEIRKLKLTIPILFLTAKDAPSDRVEGLECGADDYLIKPFFTEELLARIKALLRRTNKKTTDNTISIGDLTLHILHGEAIKGNEKIQLTAKEAALLSLLMHNVGQVITKERIMEKIWGYDSDANISNVDLYIYYLRKKLNIPNIKTIRGIGYSFEEDIDV